MPPHRLCNIFANLTLPVKKIVQGASSGKFIGKWQGKLKDEVNEANAILTDRKQVKKIWRAVDFNGNGYVSLAEIDKVARTRFFVCLMCSTFVHMIFCCPHPYRW